jgi:hypothetical protein
LNRQLEHCQVPWTHVIGVGQRQHISTSVILERA